VISSFKSQQTWVRLILGSRIPLNSARVRIKFPDESVFQRISSVMRLCVQGNHFIDESVLHQISLLSRLCGVGNKFSDECVLQRITPSRVCA
jgi:hypothetical protein